MSTYQSPNNMSRRKFMALAGGAAGLAAMAAMGISGKQGECSANIPEIDIDKMTYAENQRRSQRPVRVSFSTARMPSLRASNPAIT